MTQSDTITVGLIKGRHDLPVSDYIWDEIPDVTDYKAMDRHVISWIGTHVGISRRISMAVNAAGYDDGLVFEGDRYLVVYVTGLTACTASLIKMCALNGISLTLMHFDRESGAYKPQAIF